jgi:hypothetical protein
MPWTTVAKLVFHWESQEWLYGSNDNRPKARVLALQTFYASIRKPDARMYAVSIAPHPDRPHVVAARNEAGIPSEDGRIPLEYEDIKKVLLKTKAQAVPKHGPQDLTIDIVEGKEPT